MNFLKKRQKGFTLIELIVSIFVFLIIMTIVIDIFGKQVVTARNARILERNIEEASTAMNYLAKTLRTSTLPNEYNFGDFSKLDQTSKTGYVSKIYAYDYSQGLCFKFAFEKGSNGDGVLNMYTSDKVSQNATSPLTYRTYLCALDSSYSNSEGRVLTKGNVKGSFYISPTIIDKKEQEPEPEVYDESLGKVTISLEIDNRNTEAVVQEDKGIQNMIVIQTSVSLRDYPGDITF